MPQSNPQPRHHNLKSCQKLPQFVKISLQRSQAASGAKNPPEGILRRMAGRSWLASKEKRA